MSWREGTGPTAEYVTIMITGPPAFVQLLRVRLAYGRTVNWKRLLLLLNIIAILLYYYTNVTRPRPWVHQLHPASELVACQLQYDGWFSRDGTLRGRRRITDSENVPRFIFVQPLNAFKRNYFVSASSRHSYTLESYSNTTRETDITLSCGDSQ